MFLKKQALKLALSSILGFTGVSMAQTDLANWSHTAPIAINTTPSGADLADSIIVTNFPLLVRLDTHSIDFSQAKGNGSDIRFSSLDSNIYPYQIEKWDSAGGSAAIWVQIDTIKGDTVSQINMYWGNSSAEDSSNGTVVFDTAQGFEAVWHFGEAGNTDSAGFKDATSNSLHGTGYGFTQASAIPSIAGNGLDFVKANGNYIDIPNSASGLLNFSVTTDPYTISTWVNLNDIGNSETPLIVKGDYQYAVKAKNTGEWEIFRKDEGWINNRTPATANQWVHITAVFNGRTSQSLYIDGALASNTTNTGGSGDAIDTFNLNIGRNAAVINRLLDGKLDEVRISSVTRSADWIKLNYASQNANQTVVNFLPTGCTDSSEVFEADSVLNTIGETDTLSMVATPASCATSEKWVLSASTNDSTISNQDSIQYISPRLAASDTLIFKYKATFFSGTTKEKVFTVIVNNSIPDPILSINAPANWDGLNPLRIAGITVNKLALTAPNMPPITYRWTSTGIFVDMIKTDSSLTISNPRENGNVTLKFCADNGGDEACQTITYSNIIVAISNRGALSSLIELNSGSLVWNQASHVQIFSINGKTLLNKKGQAGDRLQLTPEMIQGLKSNQLKMTIRSLVQTK